MQTDKSLSSDPVVLITGCTTGIGLELLRLLLKGHWRIIATARQSSLARLGELGIVEGPRLWIRALDVTSQSDRQNLAMEVLSRFGALDVLVNNAGISYRSVMEQMDSEANEKQFRINYLAPIELIRLFLPSMREQRSGRILNISSVGGMMAMPTMGAYSASKFALEGASESLWYELKPWGIKVSLLQPGFVRSESFRNVALSRRAQVAQAVESDPYHSYYRYMTPFVERLMWQSSTSATDVARRIENVMQMKNPPLRVAVTRDAWFFYLLRRLLPRTFYHWLLYRNLPQIDSWGPQDEK